MAKVTAQEQQAELAYLQKQRQEYQAALKVINDFNKASQQKRVAMESELLSARKLKDSFVEQFKSIKDINSLIEKVSKGFSVMTDELTDQQKRIKSLGDDWGEINDLQTSISSHYGKQYDDVKAIQKKIDGTRSLIAGISELIQKDSNAYGDQLEKILDIAEQYKGMPTTFATLAKERKLGLISEKQMSQQLKRNQDEFEEMVSKLQITNQETEKLVGLFQQLNTENTAFNSAKQKQAEGKSAAAAYISASPLGQAPVVGQATSGLVESIFSEEKIVAASLIGLGFLTAKAIGTLNAIQKVANGGDVANTFVGVERRFDATLKNLELEIEAREKILELQSGFTQRSVIYDFSIELKQLTNEFEKSSKTALFGAALGEMPYATNQMQLAGIGAESVVSAMNDLSKTANIGIFPKLAANAAVFAKKMGISTSELGTQVGLYRRLNKVGGAQAMARVQTSISSGGIDPTTFSSDMADASKLTMFYNIKSYEALAKQVKAVRMLGASFAEIGESGKNMVLNYKDSIKSEMELSAMLGERVDLSEARALFNAGQGDKAFAVLKSSGLLEKAQAQGMFSVQALQGALQGMDLTQLGAAKYQVGQSINAPSNAGFLDAFKNALETGKINAEVINIEGAIIRAQDSKLQQGLNELIATDKILTGMDLTKRGIEVEKFLKVESENIADAINPFATLRSLGGLARGDMNLDYKYRKIGESQQGGLGLPTNASGYGRTSVFDTATPRPKIDVLGELYGPQKTVTPSKTIQNRSIGQPTTAKGIDYLSRMPDKQQEVINLGKMQDAKLKELNSKNETSIQLLKSLRDLTAIMMDPDRAKDFNVQLNMDGKQIHNVLIRNTENLKGTTKGGVTFATK